MFEMVLSVLLITYMSIVSRMHGGGLIKLPWGLDAWLLCLPYLIFTPLVGYWIIPAYLCAVLGVRLGHGRGFNYRTDFEPESKPERIEAVISDKLPVFWQKFLIMALTGCAVTMLLSIVLLPFANPLASVILLLSGSAKALAYLLPNTEHSELVRGAFLGLGVVLASSF